MAKSVFVSPAKSNPAPLLKKRSWVKFSNPAFKSLSSMPNSKKPIFKSVTSSTLKLTQTCLDGLPPKRLNKFCNKKCAKPSFDVFTASSVNSSAKLSAASSHDVKIKTSYFRSITDTKLWFLDG